MAETTLSGARNFRQVDGRLATSGQPTERQLASAADAGVRVVINLGLHDDARYALADEKGCVEALGMTYVHIPVNFAEPLERDVLAFFDAMDAHRDSTVLVHCAANYRVTAFVGLYRAIRQDWATDDAFALMRTVWEPNETWARFIAATLATSRGSSARGDDLSG